MEHSGKDTKKKPRNNVTPLGEEVSGINTTHNYSNRNSSFSPLTNTDQLSSPPTDDTCVPTDTVTHIGSSQSTEHNHHPPQHPPHHPPHVAKPLESALSCDFSQSKSYQQEKQRQQSKEVESSLDQRDGPLQSSEASRKCWVFHNETDFYQQQFHFSSATFDTQQRQPLFQQNEQQQKQQKQKQQQQQQQQLFQEKDYPQNHRIFHVTTNYRYDSDDSLRYTHQKTSHLVPLATSSPTFSNSTASTSSSPTSLPSPSLTASTSIDQSNAISANTTPSTPGIISSSTSSSNHPQRSRFDLNEIISYPTSLHDDASFLKSEENTKHSPSLSPSKTQAPIPPTSHQNQQESKERNGRQTSRNSMIEKMSIKYILN